MNAIECYEDLTSRCVSTINAAGRYSFQEEFVKRIPMDIVKKLDIKPNGTLLDVGCNLGDITIPLSFVCKSVTGVDGGGVIEKLQERVNTIPNINLVAGDFLVLDITEKYDYVLSYSVLHYLESFEKQMEFILKVASCLKPGGRALVGDIPNVSKKERFKKSIEGLRVDASYQEKRNCLSEGDMQLQNTEFSGGRLLTDHDMMEVLVNLREHGYETFLLPQRHDLPFGCTREDILICRWE